MTVLHSLPTAFLVCQNPMKIAIFKKTLKSLYYILNTDDCSSAIDWIKNTQPEIIILDFTSLDEPLANFCLHIQQVMGEKKPPIFLISSAIKKTFITDSLKAGISDFIHEPLDPIEIYERIAVHLSPAILHKKIKKITHTLKNPPLIPKNSKMFLNKTLIRDKTLRTIIETKKTEIPLSVLTIRLDSLIKLNETIGEKGLHEVGDQIEVFLKLRLRQKDFYIKEGEGHYLIILPKTSSKAGKIIAEDIQKEISQTNFITSNTEILVTVSIGVISFEKELSTSAKSFEIFEQSINKVEESLAKTRKKETLLIY